MTISLIKIFNGKSDLLADNLVASNYDKHLPIPKNTLSSEHQLSEAHQKRPTD